MLADHYIKINQRSLTTIGRLSSGDSRIFDRLKNGGTVSMKVYDKITIWFATNWPADLEWPKDIPRPVASANKKSIV